MMDLSVNLRQVFFYAMQIKNMFYVYLYWTSSQDNNPRGKTYGNGE